MENNEFIDAKDIETSANSPKNIEYIRAPFPRRVFACFLDAIIFLFVALCCFLGCREIVTKSKTYQAKDNELTTLKVGSGLYSYDANNVLKDTIGILDTAPEHNAQSRKIAAEKEINTFFAFAKERVDEATYKVMMDDYDAFRTNSSMAINGTKMFVEIDGVIVENEELISTASGNGSPIYKEYYEKCYKKFIDDHLQGYLNTKIPGYLDLNKYIVKMLVLAEILPAFLVSFVITYYVPGFIFKRGRSTFGKRLYKVASIGPNCVSPSVLRYTARTGLFLLELILAFPSFGATLLISFTMMAVSKHKQGFPDYMTGINEVRTETNKIYMSIDEADLDNIETHKEAIKFTTKNFD